jgi:hypothetical protein
VGGTVGGDSATVRAADLRAAFGEVHGGAGLAPDLAQDIEQGLGVLRSGQAVPAVDDDERRTGGAQPL